MKEEVSSSSSSSFPTVQETRFEQNLQGKYCKVQDAWNVIWTIWTLLYKFKLLERVGFSLDWTPKLTWNCWNALSLVYIERLSKLEIVGTRLS